ncbi:MAG TPA: glycosyltransferase, partial [Flavobacteriales bacterium]|nr:glycosyltransferase [Flavobacteriales bacterium]
GKKSLLTLRYIKKVRKFLHETQPDILHLRSRLPAWIGYLAWKKLPQNTRPSLVTTVHGPYTVGKYSSVMLRGERIIAVSNMIQDYIVNNYPFVDENKIEVIHRGVDTTEYTPDFSPSEEWKSKLFDEFPQMRDTQLLTLPARLTRWKGQEDFIELIDALVKEGQDVHGVIVGGAHPKKQEYVRELQSAIDDRGLHQQITMVGHRADLKEILSISDIVFSLSTEPEAFGRTTIEALSLGTPVIGYNHGGVKEQLEGLFPEGAITVGNLGEAILKVQKWFLTPPSPVENNSFTLNLMCDKTIGIYKV